MTHPTNTPMTNQRDAAEAVAIDPAEIWREAYIAVYGCPPTHRKEAYQAAYDVIARALASLPAATEQERTCEACGKPCDEDRLHVDGSGFMACEAAFTDDGSGDCPMSLSKEEWRLNPYIVNQANREVWAQGYAAGKRAVPAPSDQEKLVAWCFDVSSAPEDVELLVYRHDKPSPWSYGYRVVAMKSDDMWFAEHGDEITAPVAWTRIADIPRCPSVPDLIAAGEAVAECPSSPDGRHQVDTSMESGPNNCFHCERPMPKQGAAS